MRYLFLLIIVFYSHFSFSNWTTHSAFSAEKDDGLSKANSSCASLDTTDKHGVNYTQRRVILFRNVSYYCQYFRTDSGVDICPSGESWVQSSESCEALLPDDTPDSCSPNDKFYVTFLGTNCLSPDEDENQYCPIGFSSGYVSGQLQCIETNLNGESVNSDYPVPDYFIPTVEGDSSTQPPHEQSDDSEVDHVIEEIAVSNTVDNGDGTSTTTTTETTSDNQNDITKTTQTEIVRDNSTGEVISSNTVTTFSGTGIGDENGESEEEGSAESSNSCDVRPSCEGDPHLCAILIQSWENSCGLPEWIDEDTESIESFMGQEGFFESDYNNGFQGIWDDKKDEIRNSSLLTWLDAFTFPDAGTCPVISLTLWVVGPVTIPSTYCYLFPILRSFFILSAIFFGSRLIFGGA